MSQKQFKKLLEQAIKSNGSTAIAINTRKPVQIQAQQEKVQIKVQPIILLDNSIIGLKFSNRYQKKYSSKSYNNPNFKKRK